jgi:hypothetical protein
MSTFEKHILSAMVDCGYDVSFEIIRLWVSLKTPRIKGD